MPAPLPRRGPRDQLSFPYPIRFDERYCVALRAVSCRRNPDDCTLASRLGTQQLTWHAYEGQTSQQVRAETAEIQSGIPHCKQQPPRKPSGPRR
jgi:hypothetical protein